MALSVVCILLTLYWLVLFARIITSWLPAPQSAIGRGLFEVVHDLTEPVLGMVRGLLPAVRMGGMGLDLSPVLVFIGLAVLRQALGC